LNIGQPRSKPKHFFIIDSEQVLWRKG